MLVLMALVSYITPTSERDIRIFLWLAFIAIVLGCAVGLLIWYHNRVGR